MLVPVETLTVTLIAASLPGFVYATCTFTSTVFVFDVTHFIFSILTSFNHQLPVKSRLDELLFSNYTKIDGKQTLSGQSNIFRAPDDTLEDSIFTKVLGQALDFI